MSIGILCATRFQNDNSSCLNVNGGEGDCRENASLIVDKIFSNDRLVTFDDNNQLLQGHVVINPFTNSVQVDWDHNDETLPRKENENGRPCVMFTKKVGLFDRCTVGFGSRVTDAAEKKIGTVREKRFLVTLALHDDGNYVLQDIPAEQLLRYGNYRKDDKVVYDKEWIGLVVDTRARTFFKMDKDGASGYFGDTGFGYKFPPPGEKIKQMCISSLWDCNWDKKEGNWFWKFLKYLSDPATVQKTEIDVLSIAWMGRVSDPSGLKENSKCPSGVLRKREEVAKVEYMYGRNWKYVRELETWAYEIKEGDSFIHYDTWMRTISDRMFFGLNDKTIEIIPDEILNQDKCTQECIPGNTIFVRIVMWRSIVDVEWEDGSRETLPTYAVKPYYTPVIGKRIRTPLSEKFIAGDIVLDLNESNSSPKYGMLTTIISGDRALVRWIIPDVMGHSDPCVSELVEIELSELTLFQDYLYLRNLYQTPFVVAKNQNPLCKIKYGIVVGMDVPQGKIILKSAEETEHSVWAHDYIHLVGDVMFDVKSNKWVNWEDPVINPLLVEEVSEPKLMCPSICGFANK